MSQIYLRNHYVKKICKLWRYVRFEILSLVMNLKLVSVVLMLGGVLSTWFIYIIQYVYHVPM